MKIRIEFKNNADKKNIYEILNNLKCDIVSQYGYAFVVATGLMLETIEKRYEIETAIEEKNIKNCSLEYVY